MYYEDILSESRCQIFYQACQGYKHNLNLVKFYTMPYLFDLSNSEELTF